MKTIYEAPQADLVMLDTTDIIRTSGEVGEDENGLSVGKLFIIN